MTYKDMLLEIIEIMKTDYSGCESKKDWSTPQLYVEKLQELEDAGTLDRASFKDLVDDYLLDYKDDHVVFIDTQAKASPSGVGFYTRRYEDSLYITEVYGDTQLQIGDAITHLDGESITDLAVKYKKQLKNQPPTRQSWGKILKNFSSITYTRHDEIFEQKLHKQTSPSHQSDYKFKLLENDICYLSLNDCLDQKQITTLLENNKELLASCDKLIIDVRENLGGYDSVFHPLLDYMFPLETLLKDTSVQYTNITERNYQNRINAFKDYLANNPSDPLIQGYVDELEKYRGQGFVELDSDKQDIKIKGTEIEKKIVVLIDKDCGSSGDEFAKLSKLSPRTTLMGRGTHGVIDYSNQAAETFEDGFIFGYSTSVTQLALEGKGYDNVGIQPDVLIPWTPEHLTEDKDLAMAINHLTTTV